MKPSVSILFIYGLAVTLLVFIYRSGYPLLLIMLINGLIGFSIGLHRHKYIVLVILLGIWGVFLNALFVSNTGEPVYVLGSLVIREGVVDTVYRITCRLVAIAGAALILISLYSPREIINGLESQLRLPKIISFPLAYGLRLLPLMKKDLDEIKNMRRQRGYRTIPLSPRDYASLLQPLLSISIERAVWTGIAIELRGFRLRRPGYRGFSLNYMDYMFIALLVAQIFSPLYL